MDDITTDLAGLAARAGLGFWHALSYPAWARFADTLAHGPSQQAVELPETQQVMLDGIESMLAGPPQGAVLARRA
jgi:hypothetical protein